MFILTNCIHFITNLLEFYWFYFGFGEKQILHAFDSFPKVYLF